MFRMELRISTDCNLSFDAQIYSFTCCRIIFQRLLVYKYQVEFQLLRRIPGDISMHYSDSLPYIPHTLFSSTLNHDSSTARAVTGTVSHVNLLSHMYSLSWSWLTSFIADNISMGVLTSINSRYIRLTHARCEPSHSSTSVSPWSFSVQVIYI